MERYSKSTTVSIYNSVKNLAKWQDNCSEDLTLLVASQTQMQYHQLDKHIKDVVVKALQFFNLESINFPDEKKYFYDEFLRQIRKKTSLSYDEIRRILVNNKANIDPDLVTTTPDLVVEQGSRTTRVTIGVITVEIPTIYYNRLSDRVNGNQEDITRLFLRYYHLGPLSGFFWSLDKRIYQFLDRTELPTLEGFASPFNFNLDNFCSAYTEDIKFGARGDFFTYISALDVRCRIIANPPYTYTVLNRTADVVIEYVNRVVGAEVIMMYPYWDDLPSITKLQGLDNCKYKIYTGGEHVLHNYSTDEVMKIPTPLIFFILSSPGLEPTITIEDVHRKMLEITV